MSGFVSAGGKRLTGTRLVTTLGLCALACALVAGLAPFFGHSFAWLGFGAVHAASPDHAIFVLRVEQIAESLLVGAALGGAGCALQALLRNPLAEPFTLGISSGSSLAAVLAIRLGAEQAFGAIGVSGAALAGALATLVAIAYLARIGRQLPPATLILAGVAISMFCSSASVLIQYTSDFSDVAHMLGWTMGGLDPAKFDTAKYMAAPIAIGMVALVLYGPELNALAAGEEVASSLGVAVARTQIVVFLIASLLVGGAIAIGGPIGFIGLVVPHVLRSIIGPDHRALLPASMLGGALVLTVCDTLTRCLLAWARLPTGAVTAVLGVPFFFAIMLRHKRDAAMWGRA